MRRYYEGDIYFFFKITGIGENSHEVRDAVLANLETLQIRLDRTANEKRPNDNDDVWRICEKSDDDGASLDCLVVMTNEELEIAQQIQKYVSSDKEAK